MLKKQIKRIKGIEWSEDFSLKQLTTFKIGGNCQLFVIVHTKKALKKLVKMLEKDNTFYKIIGGGSNLLIGDENFDGVIIKLGKGFKIIKLKKFELYIGAGMQNSKLSAEMLNYEIKNFEFLQLIPGELGGSIVVNCGANGNSISNGLLSVIVLQNHKYVKLYRDQIDFGYRNSSLKNRKIIVVEAEFERKNDTYQDIKNRMTQMKEKRIENQKVLYPNAGCIFKNPPSQSAGKIIDELGLKGFSIGGARISTVHANFIENYKNASAKDVTDLIEFIQEKVYNERQILLEKEIIYFNMDGCEKNESSEHCTK